MLSENDGKIIGYNFGGADLLSGSGVLATVNYTPTAESSSLSLGVDGLGNVDGALTDDNDNNFATVTFGGDLVHGPADCSGAFGGSLVNDAFGLCDGDGTIHGAINAAESGDTISVPNGTYGPFVVSPDSAAFIAP
jgi:hypothetical protein